MCVAICLLIYGLVVSVLVPPLLLWANREGRSPRVGLLAWLGVVGAVLVSWMGALISVGVDVMGDLLTDRHLDPGRCFSQLHNVASGVYGSAARLGLLVLIAFGFVSAAVLMWRLAGSLARARAVTHDHARVARIVGRRHERHDAVVIDHPEPAAYSVAGNPHTIVLTRAIVAVLDEDHLAAVMAHERAHLSGRHHVLLAITRALAAVCPRLDVFVTGAAQVALLVEMIADDVAADQHGASTVREALLALAEFRPAGPLGATEVGLLVRVRRLSSPSTTAATGRLASSLAIGAVLVGPLIATIAAASGTAICLLF
ncbi:M56 family metallopeptidase [Nocardia salmonicida]|uniref:M56 family metallopeptidase n=1 Tax=Nocardia salmonicida TaxID=53431 RepID=UPI00366D4F09